MLNKYVIIVFKYTKLYNKTRRAKVVCNTLSVSLCLVWSKSCQSKLIPVQQRYEAATILI